MHLLSTRVGQGIEPFTVANAIASLDPICSEPEIDQATRLVVHNGLLKRIELAASAGSAEGQPTDLSLATELAIEEITIDSITDDDLITELASSFNAK